MKQTKHIISKVNEGGIAWEMEIESGDELVSINGEVMEDIFDYQYLCEDTYIEVLIRKPSGEEWLLEIDKDEDEDLGIEFENGLMDEYRTCHNKCIFCFIDQMPPGMRDTLYFKDDDSRLSFLQGNYVTLTNMSEKDINRIIRYRLEPINISFQTTNPELRCMMLHNRFAGDALKKVEPLFEAGIRMNGQIVLCKGVNDGDELERSIRDLTRYIPYLESVSVVPVGLSKYRDGLYPLESFDKESSEEVIDLIEKWQKEIYEKHGYHFIHASDEWYIQAGRDFPEEDRYDGYLQLENGVGMMRLLLTEFEDALKETEGDNRVRNVSFATGLLAQPVIEQLCRQAKEKYPNIQTRVYGIVNEFFGEKITVSGLITGQDLMKQLSDRELGETLYIPQNMLRSGCETLLDDYTVTDVSNSLQVPVHIVKSSGYAFLRAITGDKYE